MVIYYYFKGFLKKIIKIIEIFIYICIINKLVLF